MNSQNSTNLFGRVFLRLNLNKNSFKPSKIKSRSKVELVSDQFMYVKL